MGLLQRKSIRHEQTIEFAPFGVPEIGFVPQPPADGLDARLGFKEPIMPEAANGDHELYQLFH